MAERERSGRFFRVPKGTPITGPGTWRKGKYERNEQGASRVVEAAFIDTRGSTTEITWAGSGGYWLHANINDVIEVTSI